MTTDINTDDTIKIAALNDAMRHALPTVDSYGTCVVTPMVTALSAADQATLVGMVADFHEFSEDNDPYNEHDFGSIEFQNQVWFWKIDYYDSSCQYRSDDPACNETTTRVLTILHSSEY